MDEKGVEELKFHEQTVASDDNSSLHLIREKEMEISGKMLAVKREADEIVAQARHSASEIINAAHDSANTQVQERNAEIQAQVKADSAAVRNDAAKEAESLEKVVSARQDLAVEYVVRAVTGS